MEKYRDAMISEIFLVSEKVYLANLVKRKQEPLIFVRFSLE